MNNESEQPIRPVEPLHLDRRRLLLYGAGLSAAAVGGLSSAACAAASSPAALAGETQEREVPEAYTLPALPYAYGALEPVIGARIMELHHSKHHRAYVDKLTAAIDKHPELYKQDPAELLQNLAAVPEDIREAVRNHGGGHVNHSQFWRWMAAPGEAPRQPSGELAAAIDSTFGDLARFQEAFNAAGGSRFGSGWVWLSWTKEGRLEVSSTANQDTPLSSGAMPLLGNDVWEHAYYLTYENRRGDYLKAWWRVVDWARVAELFNQAKRGSSR